MIAQAIDDHGPDIAVNKNAVEQKDDGSIAAGVVVTQPGVGRSFEFHRLVKMASWFLRFEAAPPQIFDGLLKAGRVLLPAQPTPSIYTLLLKPLSAQNLPVAGDFRVNRIQDIPVAASALPAIHAHLAESELEPGFLAVRDIAPSRIGGLEYGFCCHRI